jgi:16S rRNA C967 or C1407 C5-methylase (RsmB/RsmF family)
MPQKSRRQPEREKRALFLDRVARVYGVHPQDAADLLGGPRKQSVRVHRLSDRSPEEIRRDLEVVADVSPIDWCPDAYFLEGRKGELVASALFENGDVYIQNASSLVPPLALGVQPGQGILDLCASPGGKASHIASLTGNKADLWLNDGLPARIPKLRHVADLMRIRYCNLTNVAAQYADRFIDNSFDRILLDAQCSGEGRIDPNKPGALRHWSPERLTEYGYLQQRMLVAAYKLLKPGGILVYTTCTIAPEENERPVEVLLSRFPECSVLPIEVDLPAAVRMAGLTSWQGQRFRPELAQALRIRPQEHFEAFFVCKLQKPAAASGEPADKVGV